MQHGANPGIEFVQAAVQWCFVGRFELLIDGCSVQIANHQVIGRQTRFFPAGLRDDAMIVGDARREVTTSGQAPLAFSKETAHFTECAGLFGEICGFHGLINPAKCAVRLTK